MAKFPTKGGATRREFARLIIEARGDTLTGCSNYFTDVPCGSNPNDGPYITKMKDIGITAGCGGGNYCPETQTPRDQSSVFFLKGKYWPYGDDAPGTGSDAGQRLKFAGMERDTENKHYFDHARKQDFNLGRFVSADEVFGDQGTPQSWNRYSYVMNNPTTLLDPTGFATCVQDEFGLLHCDESIGVSGSGESAPSWDLENDWAHRLDWDTPTWSSFARLSGMSSRDGEAGSGKLSPCFFEGLKNGAIGSAVVTVAVAGASAFVAPEIVTGTLLLAAGAGTYAFVQSAFAHYRARNLAGLAYDAGSAAGGLVVGGVAGFGTRGAITGEADFPTGFRDFMGFSKTFEIRPGQSLGEALRAAFSKGPDLGGAGLAVGVSGTGAASTSECD